MAKITQYQRELADVWYWDYEDKDNLDPAKDIDVTKATHIAKRMVQDAGREAEFTKISGETLYNTLKAHFKFTLIAMILEEITIDQVLEYTKAGLGSDKKYGSFEDDLRKLEPIFRGYQARLNTIRAMPKEVTLGSLGTLKLPEDSGKMAALNTVMTSSGLPTMEALFGELSGVGDTISTAQAAERAALKRSKELESEVNRLGVALASASAAASMALTEVKIEANGEVPEGKVTIRKASELFPIKLDKDFDVPFWEWEGPHPDVPAKDPHYIFRKKHLERVLYALITNQREYIQGHTGSGKTTLLEQVAAHLQWPFIRINFDSEITRMDLIGRDTLSVDEATGKVVSKFEDGMLPKAMSGPYMCCFDELDFVRPDVAYVMQAALEGNGLRITEDGDRLVQPHHMFRMFGTGNTVGQGDEEGMYQGARPQSLAFLDRFTIWDRIDYLNKQEREDLVVRTVPALGQDDRKMLMKYVEEHLEAFTSAKVIQPISPRGMLAVAKATVALGSLKVALEMSVLDRANREDRAVLVGLVDRVSK